MASSSNLGGNTLEVFRLVNLSMTSAIPITEQASSGQIGQPAATMMENKYFSGAWTANARRLSTEPARLHDLLLM
jgi:hypothetical protein